MKNLALLSSIASVMLVTSLASQAAISAYAVDFNGGDSSFTGNFLGANDGAVVGAAWGAGSGVGGGGGLGITNTGQNNFYYRPAPAADSSSSFDIAGLSAGQGFRTSADFRWSNSTATDLTVINLGFSIANTSVSALSATGSVGGSIIRNGSSTVNIRLRAGNATIHTLAFNQSALTAGNWYRLSFETLKSETAGTFNSIVTLYSIGADGLSVPVLFNDGTQNIVLSGALEGAGLYSDTAAFGVYDIRNTNGINSADNFNVVLVPEPAAAAMLTLGAMTLGSRRRRL